MCWCYGLRDLGGQALCDVLMQLFIDMKQHPKRICTDFDVKVIKGKARNLLWRLQIDVRASPPYRQSQNGMVEKHWGVFRADRSAKQAVKPAAD